MANRPLPESDLDEILRQCQVWETLRGARILVTGGTGFFGKWILSALDHANRELSLDAELCVLSRNPGRFLSDQPALAHLRFVTGDVRAFSLSGEGLTHVIHGATAASAALNEADPLTMFDTIVEGTRNTLTRALDSHASRFLMISSGAVYGRQPSELSHVGESFMGGPDVLLPGAAYHEGKRAAEWLSVAMTKDTTLTATIARCFAFVGPHLPLDAHFAIGNFIRDGLAGKTIGVDGDGTPHRSYMYAADLVTWLLTILVRGRRNVAYNVGSEESVSIAELARAVADHFHVDVAIKKTPSGKPPERYVPSTVLARSELGLSLRSDLRTAIARTAAYHAPQG